MNKNIKIQAVKVKNYTPSFQEVWKKFKDITKSIAFSLVLDLFPITPMEMKGLKDILKVVEPFYQFPSEKQLLEVIIPQMYDQVKKKMSLTIKNDLKGVNAIALTIDGWTGRCIADHMTVSVHYWTENFEPRHFLLQLESLPKTWNTAQDLFHLIQNVLLKYEFSEEKTNIHIVTANGYNIVKAVSMNDKWVRIPCFARLLQLTVDDVLKNFNDFNNLVTKCHLLVSAVWSRTSLDTAPNKSYLQSSSILDEIVPSWNSIYEMFDNLLKLRTTLHIFLQELPSPPEKLTEADWESISCYIEVFSLLKQASTLMSEEMYPPLSLYLPTIRGILELMESMNLNNQLSIQLIRSMCSRFGHINTNESMIIAMVVDPRFKTRLLSEDENFTVFDIVKSKMLSMNIINKEVKYKTDKINNSTDMLLEAYFMNIKKEKDLDTSSEKMAEAELTYYLCENVVSMNTVISEWWKDNSNRFPKLSQLAKIYLSIPAVQVSTERAFPNKQGFIADTRADILTDQVNVLDLMRISFLNNNLSQFEADVCL
ncbi:PREDICTED: zinc finger BED domain-containing protein 6 [Ceratosolen solmsi marchali]|uniref:Zinc finger BED domain-containing protein 6 n=1 Tax=Ceratosolen solmsi marchali TaxID=326594 RepID=A0AAJ7DY45_9HYME|nr:PREDICTED: zinc finger BED domain-containing protein 6 [Ceratosolen solmsi marchali]